MNRFIISKVFKSWKMIPPNACRNCNEEKGRRKNFVSYSIAKHIQSFKISQLKKGKQSLYQISCKPAEIISNEFAISDIIVT